MPPKKTFFRYSENDIYEAIKEIQSGNKIRETCRKYNIPHSTIINKLKMRHPIQRKMGPATILTPDEEKLLCRWISAMAKKGIPIKKEQLIETVTTIIKTDNRLTPFKEGIPGRKWFDNFMKRNPEVAKRHAESINSARSTVTEQGIRRWHAELEEYLKTENARDILEDPGRILNADESGFQVCPSSGIVLGPRGMENFYEIKDKEKESITVLGTFSASGKVLPVMIIYPYERIPAEIARNVPEDWCLGKSPKGWMTSRVFFGYIANSLLPALRRANVKFPILLLIDGHKSHITYEVSQLCIENQIILYALHPNATHIIQPADVSVFRPLKNAWKKIVQNWKVTTGNRVVTRAQFAPLLKSAIGSATEEIIQNGFRKCGLFPFDANNIDYTKCMNHESRHTCADKPTDISTEHLLYFESLMSRNRVMEFRAVPQTEFWTGDESAKELFYVWRKIYNKVNNVSITSEPQPTTNIQNELDFNSSEKECTTPEFLEDTIMYNLPIECTDSVMETSTSLLQFESQESEQILQGLSSVSPSFMNVFENEIVTSNPPENQEKTPTKASTSNDTMKETTNFTVSPAFASSLVWPTESPLKKDGKKKSNRKRLPDAVTSVEWMQYWREKYKEQEEKENKRLAREEKKKMQDMKKIEKPKAKRVIKRVQNRIDSDSEDDNLPLINYSSNGKPENKEGSEEIGSYVIVNYEGEYFPGIVKNIDENSKEVSTMVLSTPNTFKWPDKEDKIWYANDSIVEKINAPVSVNSRGSYKVPEMAKYLFWI